MRRLLALRDLVHDAVEKTTNLVQETHEAAAKKPIDILSEVETLGGAARAVDSARQQIAKVVFDSVRATNRGVQAISEVGLDIVSQVVGPLVSESSSPGAHGPGERVRAVVESAESALNAVMGDFLSARNNGLAVRMTLRNERGDLPLDADGLRAALPNATGKVCIFVHGLGCSDSIWWARDPKRGESRSFGAKLAENAGFTPLWLRYNTGLHISENGRALARLLASMVDAYPGELSQITLIGHSMGGLVARSAAHYAAALDEPWSDRLTHVLCIGSPHFGAPLERAGNAIASVLSFFDTAGTQVPAKLINARSAGVKDLRYGYVLDEDWQGHDPDVFLRDSSRPAPFVDGVTYGFIAARARPQGHGMLGELLGDLMVQVPSASGHHHDPTRHLPFHMGEVLEGVHHVALTTHPAVYEAVQRFLTESRESTVARGVLSTPTGSET